MRINNFSFVQNYILEPLSQVTPKIWMVVSAVALATLAGAVILYKLYKKWRHSRVINQIKPAGQVPGQSHLAGKELAKSTQVFNQNQPNAGQNGQSGTHPSILGVPVNNGEPLPVNNNRRPSDAIPLVANPDASIPIPPPTPPVYSPPVKKVDLKVSPKPPVKKVSPKPPVKLSADPSINRRASQPEPVNSPKNNVASPNSGTELERSVAQQRAKLAQQAKNPLADSQPKNAQNSLLDKLRLNGQELLPAKLKLDEATLKALADKPLKPLDIEKLKSSFSLEKFEIPYILLEDGFTEEKELLQIHLAKNLVAKKIVDFEIVVKDENRQEKIVLDDQALIDLLKNNKNSGIHNEDIESATIIPNLAVMNKKAVCPLTRVPYKQPYICKEDGHTYELCAIIKWFEENKPGKFRINSPADGTKKLDKLTLYPNKILYQEGVPIPKTQQPIILTFGNSPTYPAI